MKDRKIVKVIPEYCGQNILDLHKSINEAINTANEAINNANEAINTAIEQYKVENPDVDVDAILAEHKELLPLLESSQSRELDKFIAYAKQQGTKMPFDLMEMGVLAAGRKDMQNGLAELLNSLKFDKTNCSECGEEMDNRGRSKKNYNQRWYS